MKNVPVAYDVKPTYCSTCSGVKKLVINNKTIPSKDWPKTFKALGWAQDLGCICRRPGAGAKTVKKTDSIIQWQPPTVKPKQSYLILVVAGPKRGLIKNHNYKSRIYTGSYNAFSNGKEECWSVDGAGSIMPHLGKHEEWKIHQWAYLPGYEPK